MPFPTSFHHHRLEAYRLALPTMTTIVALAGQIPTGHRPMADQLKRSATGMVANLVEGANRRSPGEKRQRYNQALGEAGEAEGWLEMAAALGLIPEEPATAAAHDLARVARMLGGLIRATGR